MSLKLVVQNNSIRLADDEGIVSGELYKSFKRELAYQPEDYLWRQNESNPNWDGYISCVCYSRAHCKCSVPKDGIHFPTGLFSRATQFFRDNSVAYDIADVRGQFPTRAINYSLSKIDTSGNPFQLYDYQVKVIDQAIAAQRGIIQIATGGGKTKTAAGIIAALGVSPTIFYVTSCDLLRQAKADIEEVLLANGKNITVGTIGGGSKVFGDVTVMTVQTAIRALGEKYKKFDEEDEDDSTEIEDVKADIRELIQSAKLIICDEVQHWKAETCQVISDNSFSSRWRYGLSATPYRDAGDDLLIDACFGKKICQISASYLIKRDFLVKPYIAFVPIRNMKGQKLGSYPTTYKQGIVENSYRNEWIAGLSEKLIGVKRTVLVLVQQIQHGEELERLIAGSVFLHGSSGKKLRSSHIQKMRDGKAPVTIASTIFDEGIDVRPLNALILAGGGKSPTRAMQRVGRVIRKYTYPNGEKKNNAFVYDLHDHLKYCTDHGLFRRKMYRTEEEFDIRDLPI
jgi:superfamily II DNA or RNA helicase